MPRDRVRGRERCAREGTASTTCASCGLEPYPPTAAVVQLGRIELGRPAERTPS
jgi:hypothetical protein